jgi:hypothetical protein
MICTINTHTCSIMPCTHTETNLYTQFSADSFAGAFGAAAPQPHQPPRSHTHTLQPPPTPQPVTAVPSELKTVLGALDDPNYDPFKSFSGPSTTSAPSSASAGFGAFPVPTPAPGAAAPKPADNNDWFTQPSHQPAAPQAQTAAGTLGLPSTLCLFIRMCILGCFCFNSSRDLRLLGTKMMVLGYCACYVPPLFL